MVKLFESMASSFDKYLVEEVEEKENINECNDSFVESINNENEREEVRQFHNDRLKHTNDKIDSLLKRKNESLENGKTDSREAAILDKIFYHLRDLKSDEEFADFCLNKLEMTEEELRNFCGLNADGSLVECMDNSLTESAWDELKSYII